MTDDFRLLSAKLHDATSYQEFFSDGDESTIKSTYRKLMMTVHPDRVAHDYQAEATAATDRLGKFYQTALEALRSGTFGMAMPLLVLSSKTMQHECLRRQRRFFDMTLGYTARSTGGSASTDSIVKIAKTPRDNELLAAEADALTKLAATDSEHSMFYPKLLDSFAVSDGPRRLRANAIGYMDGFVNLEEVQGRYPRGLHPLDMSWIWRRVLWALGGAHEASVLHGALVPSHIMIHPALHGVVLIDWCYSVQRFDDSYPLLKAIVGAKRDWYPKKVLMREAPSIALDFALAARSMQYVVGRQTMPDAMRRYFVGLTSGVNTASAYELLGQFDAVLERLGAPYYPRTFRPLNW